MEWAIRRAAQEGNLPPTAGIELSADQHQVNAAIIQRIWDGQERFEDVKRDVDLSALDAFIAERAPRLFRLYERILNQASRDRNTAAAWQDPEPWRFPGSMAFLERLRAVGCHNYFVTGAVLYEEGGMFEEVRALGFDVGPGKIVEAMHGSSWDRKMPKDEVMCELFTSLGVEAAAALVVGDGRKEIQAAVDMGCVAMSRLDTDARRLRQLHAEIGTNYVVADYTDPALRELVK
jgi:phosphoglycolate phosphatase-like HAD superfamily hydrolase